MNKLLTILTAVMLWGSMGWANDVLFQKTYTVEGMKAAEIEQAFGDKIMKQEDGVVDQLGFTLSLLNNTLGGGSNASSKTGKQQYPIKCVWMGTTSYADADVILQAKDGRYRVTVANAIDGDSGRPVTKMNPSFIKSCESQIAEWADGKFQQVKKLAF
jgi:hypothetical protein